MRHLWLIPFLLAVSSGVCAGQTLRVGQQVLTVGDTASHTLGLLGTPGFKEPVENEFGAHVGERWQYTRDGGRVVIVTIVHGKVANIEDRRS